MWQTELVEILRVLIGDIDSSNQKYTDETLIRLLVVGAFQVAQELAFPQEFTISISGQTISPDPTDTSTKDVSFCNLVCLKAACILDNANAISAATSALAGKDGFSSFDMRGVAEARIKLLQVGLCNAFEEAKEEYEVGSNTVAGAIIMGPFRTAAGYNDYPVIQNQRYPGYPTFGSYY